MTRILQIARREFLGTVMTKGFLIGVLLVPALIAPLVLILPRLMVSRSTSVAGEIAIIDPTGAIADRARANLSPDAFAERRRRISAAVDSALPSAGALMGGRGRGGGPNAVAQAALGDLPALRIVVLPPDADLDAEKARLRDRSRRDSAGRRLAMVVIHPHAIRAASADSLGSYDFFIREKFDLRLSSEIRAAIDRAIVDARIADRRLDVGEVRALVRVRAAEPRTVGQEGESTRSAFATMLMPMAFLFLTFIAVMTSGPQLLNSTIEEKSSRVVELVLAAVSSTELMAGKILGQLGVGLLLLALYGGLGILALVGFAALGLLEPMMLVWLFVFFLIAFVTMSGMMAAIGAAVSDIRDAQGLITPVMLVSMLPMMLWMPVSQDPGSTLATVLSFVPPVGPFVMLLRVASSTPPPAWQIALAIAVGMASAVASVWFAGKVFRVALLLHGKPPSFATLVRWVRAS